MTTDEKYADKIAKLLAKAESTNHPAEAETFIAKAQELMTKYAIDEAMVEAARVGSAKQDSIVTEEFVMTGGFRVALGNLCSFVIKYNNAKAVMTDGPRMVDGKLVKQTYILKVTGYKSDLDRIRMLYTSLHLQAARAQANWWQENKHVYSPEYMKRQGFLDRRQFLFSFASTVGTRLKEGYEKGVAAAKQEHGTGMELVLRDRSQAVLEKYEELYPFLRTVKQRQTGGSWDAHSAGTAAGQRADLGGPKLGSPKKQLGK